MSWFSGYTSLIGCSHALTHDVTGAESSRDMGVGADGKPLQDDTFCQFCQMAVSYIKACRLYRLEIDLHGYI